MLLNVRKDICNRTLTPRARLDCQFNKPVVGKLPEKTDVPHSAYFTLKASARSGSPRFQLEVLGIPIHNLFYEPLRPKISRLILNRRVDALPSPQLMSFFVHPDAKLSDCHQPVIDT